MNHLPITGFISRSYRLGIGLLAAVLLTACASTPNSPVESLNAARSAITSAEQAEARQYAPADLEEARAQLKMAEEAVLAEEMLKAERLAIQSRLAAELAMARTEATKATAINQEMERSSDALEEEMKRQGTQQ
ncbi:DUF4398 domain-containing protein [Salinispirillum sp. LH 10-3-1]|uniref:DUF4398 domain-containing protein n=1 Tax=Salinispirillum sp. LH 10-3-1 TaxID=2952525 RepID=A0AB38YE91_9GAMM